MKLGICAIFKNEGRYLREWVQYHRLIGFDGFVLYDNGSTDYGATVLEELSLGPAISVVPWPVRPGQRTAYQDFTRAYARHFDWVAFIDIDEFIHPLGGDNIRSCIEIAGTHSAILMNWMNFGPASYISRPAGLVTELYTLRLPDDELWHCHIKSLVRVSDLIDCESPHTAHLRGKPCNARGETIENEAIQPVVCHDSIVINHYYTKSLEDWEKKVAGGRATTDDASVQRNQVQFDYCRSHAIIPDHRIQRFLPSLRDALNDRVPCSPLVIGSA